MKCLILCGGRGMIDPSSKDRIPKALLKVGNRPLVWHVMKLFSSYGFTDFVLALGQGSEEIKQYFIELEKIFRFYVEYQHQYLRLERY